MKFDYPDNDPTNDDWEEKDFASDKEFVSLFDMTYDSFSSFKLYEEIKSYLVYFANDSMELSRPDLLTLLKADSDYYSHHRVREVIYFGFLQDAVLDCIKYDERRGYFDETGSNAINAYSSYDYWAHFFNLMNHTDVF